MNAADDARRVVIVGASAAGLRCACRLARLRPGWSITVVEQRERFSYAACGLPYVLSGDIDDLDALRRTADGTLRDERYFAAVKGVNVVARSRATAIDVVAQRVEVVGADARSLELSWDDLVLASGASARTLPGQPVHPRVHTLHTQEDVAALSRLLAAGRLGRAAIVGAGLAGCEAAEAFRALWGTDVIVLEAAATPLPGVVDRDVGSVVAQALKRSGVDLRCGCLVESIEPRDDGVTVLACGERIDVDAVVVAVGVAPAVALARDAGIEIGPTGAIAVQPNLATSVPGVWAIGDCVEVQHAVTGGPAYLPLGSLANRQGRVLANVLAGKPETFPPVAGAIAVKVFGCNVAASGITRVHALSLGLQARAVWVCIHDKAHYWPEAKEIFIELVYEQETERVLGVQIAGEGEACKRADVATQVIARQGTLADLAQIEHAYAPPYSPAVEPLAVAAWVAQNQEDGIIACSPLEDLAGEAVLDVRHPEEQSARPIASTIATSLPLANLRGNGGSLGKGPWMVVCERGARAAEALRWMQAHDRYARYLGGGIRFRDAAGGGKR